MAAIEEDLLSLVQKPARYIGREWNAVVKDPQAVDIRWALCFPDVYDVGMSHLGLKVLYHVLNQRDNVLCERAFLPWPDYAELIRSSDGRLTSLENRIPLSEFDIVGFSLQYELSYPSVLRMLELGGIEIHAARRGKGEPIVVGGGPCAFNPEPIAAFFDAFALGDGEEVILEITEAVRSARLANISRHETLHLLSEAPGVYVPSFYEAAYGANGRFSSITPREGAKAAVSRRFVRSLETAPFPTAPVVPYVETVHDRVAIEITRGCTQGCRFCHAGMTCRPTRERSRDTIVRLARESVDATGYDEVSLLSLSTTDYSEIEALVDQLLLTFDEERVNLSLPSLRVDAFSVGLCKKVSRVRRSGITLAPEAGTQRLRDAINKRVTINDILEACRAAFLAGYHTIKAYFMIGLPTETEEDILGIVQTLEEIRQLADEMKVVRRGALVNVSLAAFVPKPHTPFQWERQLSIAEVRERRELLAGRVKARHYRLHWHDEKQSFIEGVLSRGDRRLCDVIEQVAHRGAGPEAWSEYFDLGSWLDAFAASGIDPYQYVAERKEDEPLPWEHLSSGVKREYLLRERRRSRDGIITPDCRNGVCEGCGEFCGYAD